VEKVTTTTIETCVSNGGFGEGKVRQKLGNSSALVTQSILMIKKKPCKIGIGSIMLSFGSSYSPQFIHFYNGKSAKLE